MLRNILHAKGTLNIFKSNLKILPTINIIKCRSYHTYPDENEVAVITRAKSAEPRKEKLGKDYMVNPKLYLNTTPIENDNHISNQVTKVVLKDQVTCSTTLPNGVTVVSHDNAEFMASFSLTVGTGR